MSKFILSKCCQTDLQSGCALPSYHLWMIPVALHPHHTWYRCVGIFEILEDIAVFLFISEFRALGTMVALGQIPILLSALIIDGAVNRGIMEAKPRSTLSQEFRSWGKEYDNCLLGFLALTLSEDTSVLEDHLLGHVWWKLLQPMKVPSHCQYVYGFLYYSWFNFTVPTQMCERQFSFLYLLSSQHIHCCWKTICCLQGDSDSFGLKPCLFYVNISLNWKFAPLFLHFPSSKTWSVFPGDSEGIVSGCFLGCLDPYSFQNRWLDLSGLWPWFRP